LIYSVEFKSSIALAKLAAAFVLLSSPPHSKGAAVNASILGRRRRVLFTGVLVVEQQKKT